MARVMGKRAVHSREGVPSKQMFVRPEHIAAVSVLLDTLRQSAVSGLTE